MADRVDPVADAIHGLSLMVHNHGRASDVDECGETWCKRARAALALYIDQRDARLEVIEHLLAGRTPIWPHDRPPLWRGGGKAKNLPMTPEQAAVLATHGRPRGNTVDS